MTFPQGYCERCSAPTHFIEGRRCGFCGFVVEPTREVAVLDAVAFWNSEAAQWDADADARDERPRSW